MAFYPIKFAIDGDSWLVTSPDFPEVTTFGDTQEDGARNAVSAIEEAISSRMADNQVLPPPYDDREGGQYAVQLPSMSLLKSWLYMICKLDNISRAELQRRLDVGRETIDRLFRLDHNSKLDQLERAFEAVGHPLEFGPAGRAWTHEAA
ncbi:type II toxin-antitoxin system HicB family antitoxin [Acuticoccus sp. MNP-M23]|uniref:type II toxin-antitoxin system HicB family antitoxin n=1 Tax=Acuticoccus sp. MNP-M23 TaxID=3072793 RepID=UPI00281683B9|nr:type II toxin-antitoxin system HicB family antitoxin [Acuticoccus sp. MNP-M23]WMS43432.1 type II toxin-antitoxin system HicB family antitoxin [Acuticoccus sp. MNP-M23]